MSATTDHNNIPSSPSTQSSSSDRKKPETSPGIITLEELDYLHHGALEPDIPTELLAKSNSTTRSSRFPASLEDTIIIQASEDPGKGIAIFAARDLPIGTVILCEEPLLRVPYITAPEENNMEETVRDRQRIFLSKMVGQMSIEKKEAWDALFAFYAMGVTGEVGERDVGIFWTNGFEIEDEHGKASGVFEVASRFNHACVPNALYDWKESIGMMLFWNRFPLLEGEEITIDYGHKKKTLKKAYGFDCQCGGCTDSGEESSSDEEYDSMMDDDAVEDVKEEHEVQKSVLVEGGEHLALVLDKGDPENKVREVPEVEGVGEGDEKEQSMEEKIEGICVGIRDLAVIGDDTDEYEDENSDEGSDGGSAGDMIDEHDWMRHEERGWMGGRGY